MLEKIIYKKRLLALIVRGKYRNRKGITFFTPNESIQQFGYMKHKKKHIIKPHLHKKRVTKILYTTEVILLLKGILRVDFYTPFRKYLFRKILKKPTPVLGSRTLNFNIWRNLKIKLRSSPGALKE